MQFPTLLILLATSALTTSLTIPPHQQSSNSLTTSDSTPALIRSLPFTLSSILHPRTPGKNNPKAAAAAGAKAGAAAGKGKEKGKIIVPETKLDAVKNMDNVASTKAAPSTKANGAAAKASADNGIASGVVGSVAEGLKGSKAGDIVGQVAAGLKAGGL